MKAKFDIVRKRRWFFAISSAITIAGIIVFALFGFNLGTDFKAGSRIQMELNQPVDVNQVKDLFNQVGIPLGQDAITVAGTQRDTAIVRISNVLTLDQKNKIMALDAKMFPKSLTPRVDTVDPIVAKQTSQKAALAVLLA